LANSQQKEEHIRRNYEEIKEAFQKLQLEYNQKISLIGKSDIEDQNKMKRIVQLQQTVDLITQVSIFVNHSWMCFYHLQFGLLYYTEPVMIFCFLNRKSQNSNVK
jgi:hypothetical protein